MEYLVWLVDKSSGREYDRLFDLPAVNLECAFGVAKLEFEQCGFEVKDVIPVTSVLTDVELVGRYEQVRMEVS